MSDVILFSADGCAPCDNAKNYLSENNVDVDVRNIHDDQEARRDMVETYKSTSTPTIVWDDEVIVGFQKDRLDELIDQKT